MSLWGDALDDFARDFVLSDNGPLDQLPCLPSTAVEVVVGILEQSCFAEPLYILLQVAQMPKLHRASLDWTRFSAPSELWSLHTPRSCRHGAFSVVLIS